jgi:two-component sensor histidine kinase
MRFEPDRSAPTQARHFARTWARQNSLPPAVIDDLALVVTELVNNAVIHGAPPIDVELSRHDGVVRGEVSDASPTTPEVRHLDHRGGFGLRIVDSRTDGCWGTTSREDSKYVWFEILV